MGDYTKNNVKIGTCGQAYYSTYQMLKDLKENRPGDLGDGEFYLNEDMGAIFAFPYPEFDGKPIGSVSVFHEQDKLELFAYSGDAYHRQVRYYLQPTHCEGVNVYADCPMGKGSVRPKYQLYGEARLTGGEWGVVMVCPYCKEKTIFEEHEIQAMYEERPDVLTEREVELFNRMLKTFERNGSKITKCT